MVVYEKVKILQCKILVVNNEQKKIVKKKISTLTPLLLSNDFFIKDEFFSYSPSVQ